jgi:hypothetical protein
MTLPDDAPALCGAPASCCVIGTEPGCQDAEIEACVCAIDDFCCDILWDELCVDEATDCGGC